MLLITTNKRHRCSLRRREEARRRILQLTQKKKGKRLKEGLLDFKRPAVKFKKKRTKRKEHHL